MVPWFRIEHFPARTIYTRATGGEPDKIWSYKAWSPQMASLSLRPRLWRFGPFDIERHELWHNKWEDLLGQATPRFPEPRPQPDYGNPGRALVRALSADRSPGCPWRGG